MNNIGEFQKLIQEAVTPMLEQREQTRAMQVDAEKYLNDHKDFVKPETQDFVFRQPLQAAVEVEQLRAKIAELEGKAGDVDATAAAQAAREADLRTLAGRRSASANEQTALDSIDSKEVLKNPLAGAKAIAAAMTK